MDSEAAAAAEIGTARADSGRSAAVAEVASERHFEWHSNPPPGLGASAVAVSALVPLQAESVEVAAEWENPKGLCFRKCFVPAAVAD